MVAALVLAPMGNLCSAFLPQWYWSELQSFSVTTLTDRPVFSQADQFEQALLDKEEILRPGFSRINLNYFAPQAEVDYILSAIHFVADHGMRL